jgi:hypothetical protein
MNGILGGDNDKIKKKPFYHNARRHYNSKAPSTSIALKNRVPRSVLVIIAFVVFVIYIVSSSRNGSKKPVQLRDQPVYSPQEDTCTAELCNPANKCSTWRPNKKYTWEDLSNAGVFRDLYSVRVTPGCELNVKVDEDEWLVIPEGHTECIESGYGYKCRNLIGVDFRG